MKKILKKIAILSMTAILLFSVAFFGAGHCVMYDPRVAELQRRLEEMGEEARLQAERVAELERENERLQDEKENSVCENCACKMIYTRHPRSDDTIDARLENTIRNSFGDEAPVWYVARYYGTFNGASVVIMGSMIDRPWDHGWSETVAGITFHHGNTARIYVWFNSAFYTLPEAYDQDILTLANLQLIANMHNVVFLHGYAYLLCCAEPIGKDTL